MSEVGDTCRGRCPGPGLRMSGTWEKGIGKAVCPSQTSCRAAEPSRWREWEKTGKNGFRTPCKGPGLLREKHTLESGRAASPFPAACWRLRRDTAFPRPRPQPESGCSGAWGPTLTSCARRCSAQPVQDPSAEPRGPISCARQGTQRKQIPLQPILRVACAETGLAYLITQL